MRKVYPVLLLICFCSTAFAQALFNNNGASIYVKDGGFMIVKTNSLYNNVSGGSGQINNEGTIVVEGYVKNNATINGSGDTIRLQGDWVNNGAYTGAVSWVDMYGGAQQITGTQVTTFDNLNLAGNGAVKRQTINAVTNNLLQLNDAELATDEYEMLANNTSTTTITRNNGFVSSVGAGKLSRATNVTSAYFFPTGSPSYINGPSIFRPIEFTPGGTAANIYSACLVKGDATADGYNVSVTDNLLCKVNPNFYHRLYRPNGSNSADLKMFYDATADGNWSDEAHWKNSEWNYLGAPVAGSGGGFSTVTVASVADFTPQPFALAHKIFTIDAGVDVSLTSGQSTTFAPTINTTDVSTVLWTPETALSCDNCNGPVATPTATTRYTLLVTDSYGCNVSDSLTVTITNNDLLIPTGFSPNKDGVNDVFHVLNKDAVKVSLLVYNRWGEKVFETSDPLDGWDGLYKNVEQPVGVYAWECNYMLNGDTKTRIAKGNVTLVR